MGAQNNVAIEDKELKIKIFDFGAGSDDDRRTGRIPGLPSEEPALTELNASIVKFNNLGKIAKRKRIHHQRKRRAKKLFMML